MAYCTEVSAILQYLTPTIPYHILVNQRELKVQLQSITAGTEFLEKKITIAGTKKHD